MKKLNLLFTVVFCAAVNTAFAQATQTFATSLNGNAQAFSPPNETSIVKDSSGMVYPYMIWRKLIQTGDYSIRFRTNGTELVTYMLIKRTPQEKDKMMALMPKPSASAQFKIGDEFHPFKEKDITGEKIDLKALAGKVIVLNFWFIGCPPCRAEIPDLNNLSNQYKNNKDVVFVAVGLDESWQIQDFVKLNPLGYHLIYNGKYISAKYGVHLYPTNVVIDRSGKVAYSSEGGSPANPYWLQHTIDDALTATSATTASK